MMNMLQSGDRPGAVPTILVVENEVLVRMSLAEYLRSCGYRAVEAANAAEAKAVLTAGMRVDLVFTNIRLESGQNGFMLANWVRRHHPNTKVLLTSSIANAAEKASDLCANGPLATKPDHHEALLGRIQVLLRLARRNRLRSRESSGTGSSRIAGAAKTSLTTAATSPP